MQPLDLIPVPFSSVRALIATASRFCGRESSLLRPKTAAAHYRAGHVFRLALLAPELRFPIDVNATVVARTFKPPSLRVRYELADLSQVECALGQLYRRSPPELPIALDVWTSRDPHAAVGARADASDEAHLRAGRRCRLSYLSCEGATFDVAGELTPSRCAPDSVVQLQLPHQHGRVELKGQVAWVTPRPQRSRLRVSFTRLGEESRRMLSDIVFRFRLGQAPWTPTLHAPGL